MTFYETCMLYLRSLIFNICAFFITLFMSIIFLPFLVLPMRHMMWIPKIWVSLIFFLLKHITHLTFEVRGVVPKTPGLIASKHQSTFETFVFHKILKNPVYFLKKELLNIPVIGWYFRKGGMIPLNRNNRKLPFKKLCLTALRTINSGTSIILFPEGTRTAPGEKIPYKTGISLFYQALNTNVTPVALNSGVFWGRRSFLKKPGCVIIEFLPPISPGLDSKAFLTLLETQIEEKSKELLNETCSH